MYWRNGACRNNSCPLPLGKRLCVADRSIGRRVTFCKYISNFLVPYNLQSPPAIFSWAYMQHWNVQWEMAARLAPARMGTCEIVPKRCTFWKDPGNRWKLCLQISLVISHAKLFLQNPANFSTNRTDTFCGKLDQTCVWLQTFLHLTSASLRPIIGDLFSSIRNNLSFSLRFYRPLGPAGCGSGAVLVLLSPGGCMFSALEVCTALLHHTLASHPKSSRSNQIKQKLAHCKYTVIDESGFTIDRPKLPGGSLHEARGKPWRSPKCWASMGLVQVLKHCKNQYLHLLLCTWPTLLKLLVENLRLQVLIGCSCSSVTFLRGFGGKNGETVRSNEMVLQWLMPRERLFCGDVGIPFYSINGFIEVLLRIPIHNNAQKAEYFWTSAWLRHGDLYLRHQVRFISR